MGSTYVPFTQDQFEMLMFHMGFAPLDNATTPGLETTRELVYQRRIETRPDAPLIRQRKSDYALRIYSTIEAGRSRDVGTDAIRLVTVALSSGRTVAGRFEKRIHRTKGAFEKVRERAHDIFKYVLDPRHICPQCKQGLLVPRKKKGVKDAPVFYGCSNFPECKYSRDMEFSYSDLHPAKTQLPKPPKEPLAVWFCLGAKCVKGWRFVRDEAHPKPPVPHNGDCTLEPMAGWWLPNGKLSTEKEGVDHVVT